MVANEGLEKAVPIEPGPPGPTALHPLQRMQCELFPGQLLGENENLVWQWWDSNQQRLVVECPID